MVVLVISIERERERAAYLGMMERTPVRRRRRYWTGSARFSCITQ